MKAYLLVVALAVIPACGKQNDAHTLEHEAVALAKYYGPLVEKLDARAQAIWERGRQIPGNLPDVPELGRRLQEARDTLIQLKHIVDPKESPKEPSLEEQAKAAAKEKKIGDLQKLVHDSEVTLDRGVTIINGNLDTLESWFDQYERKTLAMASPAGAMPSAPTGAADPGAPAAPTAPATEQPAAAQPTPAQPTPAPAQAATQPKAAQPKAVQPKAVQPKAVQPKAVQPKATQPKPAQPKAAQPAPAPPKP